MKRLRDLLITVCLLSCAGCNGTSGPAPPPRVHDAPPAPPPPAGAAAEPAPPAPGPAAEPVEPSREPARVGVGAKGRDYGDGPVATPLAARFAAEQQVVFEIEIPHALQLFQAMHDRLPRSQDEFMREIVDANQIRLPQLPPGDRYLYDPQRGQLMVEHR